MPFHLVGSKLAHYEVLAPLGAGAMSEVYRCRDTRLDKQVALKVIHDSVARREQLVERFEQEARTAARLEHPNVARVHFAGTEGGKAFYAMELVDGWPLSELIEGRAAFRWGQYLALFCQACAGLQAATDAGICHGDVKPANIILSRDGTLKLLDFGLARFMDDNTLGHAGSVMGTPFYMAPEVVRGRPGDHRSDLYSLGASFFHLLVGRPPFDAETPAELLEKHARVVAPYLRDLGGKPPQALASLIAQLLAKAPWDRPPSYREVHARLLQIHEEMPGERREAALRWCSRDRLNSEAEQGDCEICEQPYAKRERPDSYHVDVVGWNENDGERAVASFISDALGMDTQEVEPLLRPLPYRAAFRLPRERAKRMHRRLFDLGADVSLTGADEVGARTGEEDKVSPAQLSCPVRWPPKPGIKEHTSTGRLRRPEQAPLMTGGNQRTQLVVLLSLTCLALALFALDQHLQLVDLREETEDWREHAHQGPSPGGDPGAGLQRGLDNDEVSVLQGSENAAIPRDTRPAARTLTLENDSQLTEGQVLELEGLMEKAVSELDSRIPIAPGSRTRVVDFAAEEGQLRPQWQAAPYAPVIELPIPPGLSLSDERLAALLRYQLCRGAMRQAGGPGVPAWLMESIALLLEGGPPDRGQLEALQVEELHPTQLRVGERFDSEGELALRSLAAFLVEEYGWSKLRQLLTHLAEGASEQDALKEVLDAQAHDLEGLWLAALRGKERP